MLNFRTKRHQKWVEDKQEAGRVKLACHLKQTPQNALVWHARSWAWHASTKIQRRSPSMHMGVARQELGVAC